MHPGVFSGFFSSRRRHTRLQGDWSSDVCSSDLFTCMGFYPVCPAGDFYVFGAPQIPKVVMQLSNGKRLTTMAKNLSDKNIYVQSVRVNGKDWPTPFLPYREIKNGGTISY